MAFRIRIETGYVRLAVWMGAALALIVHASGVIRAQAIPGLPAAPAAAPAAADTSKKVAAPTKDNPQATVAESAGKIDVEKPVDKFKVKDFLEETLAKYPGVYTIHAEVGGSVVTLTGHVEDDEVRDRIGQVALKVEGVVFLINQLKTDAQILSAYDLLIKQLGQYARAIGQNWLLFLLALVMLAASVQVARLFSRFSEFLLAPFTGNVLLRSVLGSVVSAGIIAGGALASLQVLGVATAVVSIFGLAGVAALAIGFAFRDITENFIASILLSTRRPFNVGDFVEVAGRAGVVKALNTRATVLLTLDGKTIRIPNATVFKEIVTNSTAATSARGTFDLLVPYDVSAAKVTDLIGAALRDHEAILDDPPPRALVDELNPAGVRLRAYYWIPTRGVDGEKVSSDIKLKVKVALQRAGIQPPVTTFTMLPPPQAPAEITESASRGTGEIPERPDAAAVSKKQARANLARDSKAADAAAEVLPADDTMQHVLNMSGGDVAAEGKNLLLKESKKKDSVDTQPEGNGADEPKPAKGE